MMEYNGYTGVVEYDPTIGRLKCSARSSLELPPRETPGFPTRIQPPATSRKRRPPARGRALPTQPG